MRPVLLVAAREVHDHVSNPLVWTLVLVGAILAALATHLGIERTRVAESRFAELQEQRAQDRSLNNGRLFGSRSEPALRAIRPPEPLSVLAAGLDDATPAFWDFSPSGVRTGRVYAEASTGLTGSTAPVDLEFLVRVVFGLLSILLAVGTIAGERESGTLLALLGQPIESRLVFAGKQLGAAATLATAISLVAAVTLATTALSAPRLVSWDYAGALTMLAAAGVVYALTCFAAGVLFSVAFSSYRLSLTVTFVVWTIGALLGVQAAWLLVQGLAPVRARPALEADRERLVEASTAETAATLGDEFVKALGSPADWRPLERDPASKRSAQERVEPIWNEHVKRTRTRLDNMNEVADRAAGRQSWLSRALALVNPAATFAVAAANVAGTGERAAMRWTAATAAYQRELDRRLFDDRPRYYALAPFVDSRQPQTARRLVVDFERKPLPAIGEIPPFEPPSRELTLRLWDASPQLAVLGLYAITLMCAGMAAFGRLRF